MNISKNDNKILNIILAALYKDGTNEGLHLNDQILKPQNIILQKREIDRLKNIVCNTGFAKIIYNDFYVDRFPISEDTGRLCLTDQGLKILREYNSYTKYLKKQDKIETEKRNDRLLKNGSTIAAIILSLLSSGLFVSSLFDKQELKSKEQELKQLTIQVDSLKQVLKNNKQR